MAIPAVAQYSRLLAAGAGLSGVVPREGMPRTEDEALAAVTKQFEAIFVSELLKEMRATTLDGGLFGKDRASQMYREMHDEALAGELANSGGLGIGKLLFESLKGPVMKSRPARTAQALAPRTGRLEPARGLTLTLGPTGAARSP